MNLKPYQKEAVEFALSRRGTLIADEMGLGKTPTAIGIINRHLLNPILITCPASLKLNWKNELQRWLTVPLRVGIADGKNIPHTNIVIANYDILQHIKTRYSLIINDESHYIKNEKAKRTKLAQSIAAKADRVVCLTGTPVTARPLDLWTTLQMLAPEEFDPPGFVRGRRVGAGEGAGFFAYAKRYCNARQVWFGHRSHWDYNGASNLDELSKRLRDTVMIRRFKRDVLAELPPKQRQIVEIDSVVDDGIQCDDEYDTAVKNLRNGARIPFEKISEVRHQSALDKLPKAIEFIKNALESSAKIIVFAHHKDVILGLSQGLSDYHPCVLTGDTDTEVRQGAVQVFQSDRNSRVFIGSITAAGVGLTLTAASHVIFVELDWNPANMTQAEDRAHRIGQDDSVLVQHLVVNGTIDAKMAKLLVRKQNTIDAIIG